MFLTKRSTIDGVRTHADLRLVDLKSTPLDHSGTMVLRDTILLSEFLKKGWNLLSMKQYLSKS